MSVENGAPAGRMLNAVEWSLVYLGVAALENLDRVRLVTGDDSVRPSVSDVLRVLEHVCMVADMLNIQDENCGPNVNTAEVIAEIHAKVRV